MSCLLFECLVSINKSRKKPRPHGHMSLLKKTRRKERHVAVGTRLIRKNCQHSEYIEYAIFKRKTLFVLKNSYLITTKEESKLQMPA